MGRFRQSLDYDFVLRGLARLPLAIGQPLAQLRGVLHGLTDYDWRSHALRHRYVRDATRQAMRALRPESGRLTQWLYTLRRFIHNSREEWESYLFADPRRVAAIYQRSHIEGLEALLEVQRSGRGLVLATCHFDSYCMGFVLLGRAGIKVNAITTAILEDPRVASPMQNFFRRKIRAMELHMGGGRLKYSENSLSYFYRALHRGEAVVIQADVPAGPNADAITVPFLGARRRMSAGLRRMTLKTDSYLSAYVCLHEGVGRYRVLCTPPVTVDPADPMRALQPVYAFLDGHIRRHPDRWLAADLFRTYDRVE